MLQMPQPPSFIALRTSLHGDFVAARQGIRILDGCRIFNPDGTGFSSGSLEIEIVNAAAGDRLRLCQTRDLDVGEKQVRFQGQVIANIDNGHGATSIKLQFAAGVYHNILAAINDALEFSSDNPSLDPRHFSVRVTDADGDAADAQVELHLHAQFGMQIDIRATANEQVNSEDRILSFSDVVVSPYTELLGTPGGLSYHRGGPDWPDWETQTTARHCMVGRPADTRPQTVRPVEELSIPVAWGGAIYPHFGHQISDFSMRIIPTLSVRDDIPFLFASRPELMKTIADAPPFFWSILNWFGVARDKVMFVERPLLAKNILVAPQAEQPGGAAPSDRHLDRLDDLVHRRFGRIARQGIIYVSRAQQRGKFAGESYLETMMSLCGITVIRPENLPLLSQISLYIGASDLIFSEGSAIHSAQLLGRSLSNVTVLVRRKGWTFINQSLQPRCRNLTYLDLSIRQICDLDRSGKPIFYSGLTVLNEEATFDWLCTIDGGCRKFWRSDEFVMARDNDVRSWLHQRVTGSSDTAIRDGIRSQVERCGLSHLVGEVT